MQYLIDNDAKYSILYQYEAQKELIDIHYYISENLQEPKIANRLINKILNSISILKYFPEAYPKLENLNQVRKLVFKNYNIIYSVNKKSKEIYILHIYYKSRNYQYWKLHKTMIN